MAGQEADTTRWPRTNVGPYFPTPPTTGKNSYICAIAESSEGGVYEAGDYVLIVADCHHAIELEFSLVNPKEREESLALRLIFSSKSLVDSVRHYVLRPKR